jgi:amino acid permease
MINWILGNFEKLQTEHYIPMFVALLLVWGAMIIVLLVLLLRKYTFGKHWTAENPNPYATETFGFPRGIFRGIITLTLLFMVILFEAYGLLDPANIQVEKYTEQLLVAFQMMIAFYFGSKVLHHSTSVEHKKSKEQAIAFESVSKAEIKAASKNQASAKTDFEEAGTVG